MASRDEVAALLVDRIEMLVRELIPTGHRHGSYWIGRHDRKGSGSFWVNLPGGTTRNPGSWRDAVSGEKGGVIDLVMLCTGTDFVGAMKWAHDWLDLGNAETREVRKRVDAARTRVQETAASSEERAAENAKKARGIWLAAKQQPFLDSPADRYLRNRGISVRRLGRMPGALGWLPEWVNRHTGEIVPPSMVAGFQTDAGQTVAVHRTYLAERNGEWGKAPIDVPRKIWPSFTGCAIRLWRGEGGLSIDEAIKRGVRETLVLCEGVEDGLSLALAEPGFRVWCAGSLSNLANIRLPACADEVVVAADNDWGKRQAEAQLNKAVLALARQGVRVRVARSHFGKDANDALLSAQEA